MAEEAEKELDLKFIKNVWNSGITKCKESKTAQKLPVHQFCEAYLSNLAIKHSDEDYGNLVTVFSDLSNSDGDPNADEFPQITKAHLKLFLLCYGPPESSLEKVKDVVVNGKEWFHGNQTREESCRILTEYSALKKGKAKGLFLIRYSAAVPGVFTMSYLQKDKFCETRILKNDIGKGGGVETITGGTYKYSKMSVFITKNAAVGNLFQTPCPNENSYVRKIAKKQEENINKFRELVKLLSECGLSQYVSIMRREEINIESFKLLKEKDLIDMGIPTGPRKMMLAEICRINGVSMTESPFDAAEGEIPDINIRTSKGRGNPSPYARPDEFWQAENAKKPTDGEDLNFVVFSDNASTSGDTRLKDNRKNKMGSSGSHKKKKSLKQSGSNHGAADSADTPQPIET